MYIIAGLFKNRKIAVPKGYNTRPTSNKLREAVFNILRDSVIEADFLDLFAGSGAMGMEAISRGAKSSTFIDNSKECIKCIKSSLASMNLSGITKVNQGDFLTVIKKMTKQERKFDIIYADPPYSKEISNQVLEMIDKSDLLKDDGYLFIEERSGVSIKEDNLKALELNKKRQFGDTMLLIYQRIKSNES